MEFQKILIIQTAFIGDVVLATSLIEKLKRFYPDAKIDFLLRQGNENLLKGNPHVREVLIWNKKKQKVRNIFRVVGQIRKGKYDLLINLQRFGATGLMAFLSGVKMKVGFDKNPFSFCYQRKFKHEIGNGKHEVSRNLELIEEWTDDSFERPKLHLTEDDLSSVEKYKSEPYITIAPTSVWFTKQFPEHKWIEFLQNENFDGKIYLLGAPSDAAACERIRVKADKEEVVNLCGELSLLESTALMRDARMNYMNDSAPMHFASAVNAPTTAIFCSTVPDFGFGPLSDDSKVIETTEKLACRPCGLHGFKACPEGHFKCAEGIDLNTIS